MSDRIILFSFVLVLFASLIATGLADGKCVHGKLVDGQCECEVNYYGTFCQTEYHCNSTGDPSEGLYCDGCQPNWSGYFCDMIECGAHGTRSKTRAQLCECEIPYSGKFCTDLKTRDVYRYYNSAIQKYIPYGVFIILPVLCMLYGCNMLAKRRHVQRIEQSLESGYVEDADPQAIRDLLYARKPSKIKPPKRAKTVD